MLESLRVGPLHCLKDPGFKAGRYHCTAPKGHEGRCRRFVPEWLLERTV